MLFDKKQKTNSKQIDKTANKSIKLNTNKSIKLNTRIAFIFNFAVNSMRVSTELYYVDVRNEFGLDALRTLTARCGCSPFRYRC